ncbi:MAG: class I SAM-dependent methyltransferase [Bacillota bacterium]
MQTEGHPILAAVYDRVMSGFERTAGLAWRRSVLAGCRGRVLDLGCGTGANFPVWREIEDLELYAADPDPHMLRRAVKRAERMGLAVQTAGAPAERLPYPDGFFDGVVMTLVLCTVDDPAGAVAEAARVLKPGGEFRFMEHVRAPGPMGWWQDRLTPLWKRVSGGCHLNRETGATIAATFDSVTWETVPTGFPTGRILLGRGRKR